jgi:thiol-disulfide isomerase/thioredoxin
LDTPYAGKHRNKKMKSILIAAGFVLVIGCSKPSPSLKPGSWRATIQIQGRELPFGLEVRNMESGIPIVEIRNATERIPLDVIRITGDSLRLMFPTFDTGINAAIKGDSLVGEYVVYSANNYRLPFRAAAGQNHRFVHRQLVTQDFSGTYDVLFFNDKNTVQAMAVFEQNGNSASGTFLTPTGDYRFLEGNVDGDTLWLSGIDGDHLFIFNAVRSGDTLRGRHWLGRSRNRAWQAVRNLEAKPPSSEKLTYLKEGFDRLDFTFPDPDSTMISVSDERFKGKVVVVQILGTWCPNCLDETRFLVDWYKENAQRGVEIVGLAYEQKADFNYAAGRVRKMVDRLGVPYPVLIAGTNDTKQASSTLPALNQVIGFPTTIFVDRLGKVAAIHTGFSGPGTGSFYDLEKQKFEEQINALISDGNF